MGLNIQIVVDSKNMHELAHWWAETVHWDMRLDGRHKDEVGKELEVRGASFLWTAGQGPLEWHTMAGAGGNEFCIS
jgi:hypothetical protein